MRRCTPEWVKDTLTLLIAWTRALPDVNVLDSDFPLIVGLIWFLAFVWWDAYDGTGG